jgi:hypothetical protein
MINSMNNLLIKIFIVGLFNIIFLSICHSGEFYIPGDNGANFSYEYALERAYSLENSSAKLGIFSYKVNNEDDYLTNSLVIIYQGSLYYLYSEFRYKDKHSGAVKSIEDFSTFGDLSYILVDDYLIVGLNQGPTGAYNYQFAFKMHRGKLTLADTFTGCNPNVQPYLFDTRFKIPSLYKIVVEENNLYKMKCHDKNGDVIGYLEFSNGKFNGFINGVMIKDNSPSKYLLKKYNFR